MTEEAQGLALPQFSASLARLVEGVSKSVVESPERKARLGERVCLAARACCHRRGGAGR